MPSSRSVHTCARRRSASLTGARGRATSMMAPAAKTAATATSAMPSMRGGSGPASVAATNGKQSETRNTATTAARERPPRCRCCAWHGRIWQNTDERFARRHHRNDVEADEIGPVCDPLIEQRPIRTLHHLIAAIEIGGHPAADVAQPRGRHPTAGLKALVDGNRIGVLEVLYHHEQHGRP